MPEVSVVIPAYNAVPYIGQAVRSVLAQTYRDVEIIVVDDGSTDTTRDVLAAFGDHIRYIYQENQERAVARNTGIAHAQGEYIAFLDADDYWHPEKIAKQMKALDECPDCDAVYTHILYVAPDGRPLPPHRQLAFPPAAEIDLLPRLLLGHFLGCSSVMARRTLVEAVGGFDPTLCYIEDWDFNLRLAVRTGFSCVAERLTHYRQYPESTALRAGQYNAQITIPPMLERILDSIDIAGRVLPPRRSVLAQAWWHCAKLDYATGNVEAGRQRFARALEYEPDRASQTEWFIEEVANLVLGLYTFTLAPFDEAVALVNSVFAHLPAEAAELRRGQRRVLARLHAAYVFDRYQDDKVPLWRHGMSAIVNDPTWGGNLGLWSITGESLIGKQAAAYLRRILCMISTRSPTQTDDRRECA